ncbi:ERG4/ERG24 ergosterol biosynthesis protein [Aspergillus tamarii]|uniref:7-dehydrocholesterol reductase n=1 Tax=Aspergillus tamarii TaxID=41984 RepID=A0A5N6V5C4_ASPTM|nr:ERG4/ERG24 ergosterol biosynthesis protein [Aspergillus tamarii]
MDILLYTWIAFQATLFTILPGTISMGQPTPAGERLCYRLNGFKCWLVNVLTILLLWVAGVIDLHFIALNWADFLSASTYYAWMLAILAVFKAHLAPSHLMDRRFSGNFFTDMYNGIELNPRIGKYWDVKLFHNGHCAMTGWTLIDLSFIALQYHKYGFITNSIIIVSLIRALVSVDFLWNEDWYLRSIDVCEETFGFYFAFGSGFFLHFMYTLQSQYLVRYPVSLSLGTAFFVLLIGGTGYGLYYIASDQKNTVRRTRGNCVVGGERAMYIKAQFVTKDGVTQESLLIYSGLWGIVRHPNYVGALLMTLAMGGVCGFNSLLPWTESIFATIFLTMRSLRDDAKCARKYGHYWNLYRERVRWNLVPGVF